MSTIAGGAGAAAPADTGPSQRLHQDANDAAEPSEAQAAFSGFDFGLTPAVPHVNKGHAAHDEIAGPSLSSNGNATQPKMSDQTMGAHADADVDGKSKSYAPEGVATASAITSPLTHPNGNELFPAMPTSEQEAISQEAITQAEISIVADNDELEAAAETSSDGGYESDVHNEGTSSISSSIRDYMYENGRRYHRFREGQYNFPNDDPEQEREDMKHAMMKLLCKQKLHFAPIGDHPQEILDMGTGTGIWAIEVGDQFRSANVLGVDLSPIQPDWLPPNVQFLVDDVESPWLHPRNHFDYIHSRHTVMAIRNWMRLFRRCSEHLKPGGWIELQEVHHSPLTTKPGGLPRDNPVVQYWSLVNDGLNALGVDFHAAAGSKLPDMMRNAGFVNVTERTLHIPIGTWPKNKVLKTVGLYWRTILMDGIQAIALGPLTRGLKWNMADVEAFLIGVRKAYLECNPLLMYMRLRIIYAQKPLSGTS